MRRSWNSPIWAGFAVTLLAAISYVPVFVRFPNTRDVPWANLLLFLTGACLLAAGLKRAYGQPVFARRVLSASLALHVGRPAPDFTLPDASGKPVTLSELRKVNRAVLSIYRGYW